MLKLPEGALDILGRGSVHDVAFSPDGDTFAVGGFKALYFYELSTMLPIAVFDTPVRRLAYSHDGLWIATSNGDCCVKVWDVQRGTCVSSMILSVVRTDGGQRRVIHQLAFSPNSQYLAATTGRDYIVEILNPETGESVITLNDDTDTEHGYCSVLNPIVFSPDSRMLACMSPDGLVVEGKRKTDFISVWNLETQELITCINGFPYYVSSFCFSPCGQFLVLGGQNGVVQVWDIARECLNREYSATGNYGMKVSYSEEGFLRAVDTSRSNSYINVWDMESGKSLYTYHEDKKHGLKTSHFSNGSRLVFATSSEFYVWKAENASQQQVPHLHIDRPKALAFSPNADILVSGCWNEGIFVWDTARFAGRNLASEKHTESKNGSETLIEQSWQQPIVFKTTGSLEFVSVTKTGKVYATSTEETTVNVWEVKPSESTHKISSSKSQNLNHWQTDSKLVLTGSFTPPTASYKSVVSPNANLLICGDVEGSLYVWDMQREELLRTMVADGESLRSLVISPDSKQLVSIYSTGPRAYLWNITDGEKIDEFPCRGIEPAAFSPCNSMIACVLKADILLWDMTTREVFMKLPNKQKHTFLSSLAFSPCGRYVASGAAWSKDGKSVGDVPVYLWDINSGENVATFFGHTIEVNSLVFSSDSTVLASGSFDGTIVLWDVKPFIDS